MVWQDIAARLLLAGILGGLIGFERETKRREAGLRTHILVCLGSALIMLTSIYLFDTYKNAGGSIDPTRIAAGAVTGIGFIGAGAIMRNRETIRGLTTAASIWVVSAIGLSVGCGFLFAGYITTFMVLVVLFVLRRIESWIVRK